MLAVLCVAVLVVNVDGTILNVALPTLVRELHANQSELQWIVDMYAMVFAGLLLVGGSLADRFGRKRLFLLGFLTFGAGSLGAALAGSVNALIAWRGVMGAGAALTIPAGLSILDNVFRDPRERARAVGIWGGTIGVGLAIGPLAGGLLLARFWWGSVFFVNVPILIVGGIAAHAPAARVEERAEAPRPDPVGSLLSVLGLGLLLWAIIEAPTKGWTSAAVLAVGGAGLAHARRVRRMGGAHRNIRCFNSPFFRSRRFSAAVGAVALGMFSPVRGGLRAHAVPPVRPRLHPARGRRQDPADGRAHRGRRPALDGDRSAGRQQADRPGGAGWRSRWPLAGLGGLDHERDLRRRGARVRCCSASGPAC